MTYQPRQGSGQPRDLYHPPGVSCQQPPGQPPVNGYPLADPGIRRPRTRRSPLHAAGGTRRSAGAGVWAALP